MIDKETSKKHNLDKALELQAKYGAQINIAEIKYYGTRQREY